MAVTAGQVGESAQPTDLSMDILFFDVVSTCLFTRDQLFQLLKLFLYNGDQRLFPVARHSAAPCAIRDVLFRLNRCTDYLSPNVGADIR